MSPPVLGVGVAILVADGLTMVVVIATVGATIVVLPVQDEE